MRIIAGEHRGRTLLPPEGQATRPITDRVKQSLFDILMPNLPEAVVYDCFAGTGSLGLESLSRGAKHAAFFETDRSALVRLKKNVDAMRVGESCRIVSQDIFRFFERPGDLPKADVIFLDPPYRFLRERSTDLLRLAEHLAGQLAAGGQIVFRHDAADQLALPPLVRADERTYGAMTLEFLRIST